MIWSYNKEYNYKYPCLCLTLPHWLMQKKGTFGLSFLSTENIWNNNCRQNLSVCRNLLMDAFQQRWKEMKVT